MATAGGFHHLGKAGNGGMGHRERGRSYGLMLLLAFAAALLGVMALHKLRERRIQNIILKEKDRQLVALHLLFQKERENSKEMWKKVEEMRAKIYSLRTKKMEVDSRVLEMESTISSLKDELRTLELALEEKREEIKALRQKETENSNKGDIQEVLNQRELEIVHLKQQLESMKISSRGSESQEEDANKHEEKGQSGVMHVSVENATVARGMDVSGTKLGVSNGTVLAEEVRLRGDGNVTGEGSVPGEPAGENDHEKHGISRVGSAVSEDEQNPDKHGMRDDSNVITTDDGSSREVSTVIEGKADLEKLDDKSNQPGNESKHWGSSIKKKLGDGNGSRIKGKRRRALGRKRRLDGKRDSIMMKHRKFIGDASQFIAGNGQENDAEKEQDQGLIEKNTKGMAQVGDGEKVSEDFQGDKVVRKEDIDQDRPGSGETSEGSIKEVVVGVRIGGGKGEETSGEDWDRLKSEGKEEEIKKESLSRKESEGSGNESSEHDQSRLAVEGGPDQGEQSTEKDNEYQMSSNLSDQLSHNVSMQINVEGDTGKPTDSDEKGAVTVGNIGGNQEGDVYAENAGEDAGSKEEVPNKAEEASIRDAEDSPDAETGRDFIEKDEEDFTDTETSRDLIEKDASKVEEHSDEYKEEMEESEF